MSIEKSIGWCDHTINPVKGLCPMACPYCYARAMYKRFKWDPEIRYDGMLNIPSAKKPSRIFIGSTMELFGDWVRSEWLEDIFEKVRLYPEHTFIFLTKQPQNLKQWSPFPPNCWVGVSATNGLMFVDAMNAFLHVKAKVKFISFEPLLEWKILPYILQADLKLQKLDWVIIGQQTPVRKSTMPKLEWIREIVEAADQAGVPVFLKDNLKPLFASEEEMPFMVGWHNTPGEFRQEFPK